MAIIDIILEQLQLGLELNHHDIYELTGSHRAAAYIFELREQGYVISDVYRLTINPKTESNEKIIHYRLARQSVGLSLSEQVNRLSKKAKHAHKYILKHSKYCSKIYELKQQQKQLDLEL